MFEGAASTFNSPGFLDLVRNGAIRTRKDDEDEDKDKTIQSSPLEMDRSPVVSSSVVREEQPEKTADSGHSRLIPTVDPEFRSELAGRIGPTGTSPFAVSDYQDPTTGRQVLDRFADRPGPSVALTGQPSPLAMAAAPVATASAEPQARTTGFDFDKGQQILDQSMQQSGRQPVSPAEVESYLSRQGQSPFAVSQPPQADLSNVRSINPKVSSQGTVEPNHLQYRLGIDSNNQPITRGQGFWASLVRGIARGGPLFGLASGIGALFDPGHGREDVYQRDTARFNQEMGADITKLREDPEQQMQRDLALRQTLSQGDYAQQQKMFGLTSQFQKDMAAFEADQRSKLSTQEWLQKKDELLDTHNYSMEQQKLIINAAINQGPDIAARYIADMEGHGQPTLGDRAKVGKIWFDSQMAQIYRTEQTGAGRGGITANKIVTEEMKPHDLRVAAAQKALDENNKRTDQSPTMKEDNRKKLQKDLDDANAAWSQHLNELEDRNGAPRGSFRSYNTPDANTGAGATGRQNNNPMNNLDPGFVAAWAKRHKMNYDDAVKALREKGGYSITK